MKKAEIKWSKKKYLVFIALLSLIMDPLLLISRHGKQGQNLFEFNVQEFVIVYIAIFGIMLVATMISSLAYKK